MNIYSAHCQPVAESEALGWVARGLLTDAELMAHQQRVAAVAQARRRHNNNNNNSARSSSRAGNNDNEATTQRRRRPPGVDSTYYRAML